MKKMVLGLWLLSISVYAWTVIDSNRISYNEVNHYIKCNNGNNVTILENTETNKFFPGFHESLDDAVRNNCSSESSSKDENNLITIKADCEIFKDRDGILTALGSNLSYSSIKVMMLMDDKYGFILKTKANVNKLKYYSPHKVTTDKHGNFINSNSEGEHTQLIIDGYYKISNKSGDKFYVRESCIE